MRKRTVQIDADRSTEPAAVWTSAKRVIEAEQACRRRPNVQIAMRAMPTGRERMLLLRLCLDDVDAIFSKTQSCLERFSNTRTILVSDRNPILDDLHARAESINFCVGIGAHDFAIQPDAQVALLLEKLKELARIGFRGNGNPERDQDVSR